MPKPTFTPAEDAALLAQIAALPAQRIAAGVLFLLIRQYPERVAMITYLASL